VFGRTIPIRAFNDKKEALMKAHNEYPKHIFVHNGLVYSVRPKKNVGTKYETISARILFYKKVRRTI
tara:strand:+ start:1545 stop:1745 length:201 start_codon:yes stop_codon:yes gene_type:complete